jgi:ribonuclease P protein component
MSCVTVAQVHTSIRLAAVQRSSREFDRRDSTCSNVRLFGGRLHVAFFARGNVRGTFSKPPADAGRETSQESRHETHFPAVEDSSCAHARLSRPDEDGRRPQGPVGAPGEGSRAAFRLTDVETPRRTRGSARYRLRGAKAFEALFRGGTRHDAEFLQLIAAPAAEAPGRVGYVIARKSMRLAVDRNRLRRKLREAVRAARPAIEAFDVILRVRRNVARSEIGDAAAEAPRLFAKLTATR